MENWSAFHLHYHGDRSVLLRHVVGPLVWQWLRQGVVDRFFFVLFQLGGPHVRLRLRLTDVREEPLLATRLREAADAFFHHHPATPTLSAEEIREQTRRLVELDPSETDDTIYPDASVHQAPFQPEADRYGGPHRLEASLAFFMASSTASLDFWRRHGDLPPSRRFPHVLCQLVAQAKGLATSPAETRELVKYGVHAWGEPMENIVRRGDQQYDKQGEVFRRLIQNTPSTLSNEGLDVLGEAARGLRGQLGDPPPEVLWRILRSQMHMTANRVGLDNPEEVYLSRILERASRDLDDADLAPTGEAPPRPYAAWMERVPDLLESSRPL